MSVSETDVSSEVAADLMRWKAAEIFDRGENPGPQANMAKLPASEAA